MFAWKERSNMRNTREITCIACPMGCRLTVCQNDNGGISVQNHGCKRGITYGIQEFTAPMRMVTTSVYVDGGRRRVCAVKTKEPIPKERIEDVLHALHNVQVKAPVYIGQVIVSNVAEVGVDVVATANCPS